MTLLDRLSDQTKKVTSSSFVLRLLSDDRVMRVTEGVLDARNRFDAAKELATQALLVLRDGHALPSIDPSLDGNDSDVVSSNGAAKPNGHAAKANGTGGANTETHSRQGTSNEPSDASATPIGPRNQSEQDLAQSMADRHTHCGRVRWRQQWR